jgi:hypothetical protein
MQAENPMSEIIKKFIEYAAEHEKHTLDGDYKKGNISHKKLMQTIESIKLETNSIRQEFYDLLNFENDSVKIWTAVTLLATFEKESIEILKKIAIENKTIIGLNADMTLDVWNKKCFRI